MNFFRCLVALPLVFACEGAIGAPGEMGPVGPGPMGRPSQPEMPFTGPVTEGCVDDQRFFSRDVWTSTVQERCFGCHNGSGVAAASGFVLLNPEVRVDALDENYAQLVRIATTPGSEDDERPLLLRKPIGELGHGGGVVIGQETLDYARLEAFVERQSEPVTCEGEDDAFLEGVENESAYRTLRRVALSFSYRLPSEDEVERVDIGGDDALATIIDELMAEEAFASRIAEGFNDLFLTEGAQYEMAYSGTVNHPNLLWFLPLRDTLPREEYAALLDGSVYGVQQSASELIKHIFVSEEPFSNILLADYTMVNPFAAQSFDVFDDIEWTDVNDRDEFHPARLTVTSERNPFPHAGLLNNYIYLARYPSTETNVNRARARAFMLQFLGTDVLKYAPLNADPLTIIAEYDNPVRDAADCAICHAIVDPIAGLYRNHHSRGARYGGPVPLDTFPAGFELTSDEGPEIAFADREWTDGTLPEGREDDRLRWLAEQTVEDPRFAQTMVQHFYQVVVGRPALTAPDGGPSIERDGAFIAFEAQRAFMRELAERFVASNFDAKLVVKALLLSPYYRARTEGARDEESEAMRFDLGVAQMMTPEMYHRKILAIFGDSFQTFPLWQEGLIENSRYRILYGGVDSTEVTTRLLDPTGIMGGVQQLVSNNVSCRQASREFDQPAESRRLLGSIELDEYGPEHEAQIRRQLVVLHERILGERLASNAAEIDRSYALFRRVRDEGAIQVAERNVPGSLNRACEAGSITEDPEYVVRAWAAVINYQMMTFEFLYQ